VHVSRCCKWGMFLHELFVHVFLCLCVSSAVCRASTISLLVLMLLLLPLLLVL
jgi:hypothetical protein